MAEISPNIIIVGQNTYHFQKEDFPNFLFLISLLTMTMASSFLQTAKTKMKTTKLTKDLDNVHVCKVGKFTYLLKASMYLQVDL